MNITGWYDLTRYSFVEVTPLMVKTKGSIDAAMIHQLLGKVYFS